jgi:hypothetical protein
MSVHSSTVHFPASGVPPAGHPDPDRLARHDAIFGELMQLEPAAMVTRMRTAPKEELPAEVLARAYHVLVRDGAGDLAEAAITRLFGGGPGDPPGGAGEPEYMRWLLVECQYKLPARWSRWRDPEDLYQSALLQILRKLRRPGGAKAHTAWKAFCGDRLIDALRERSPKKDPPQVGLEAQDPVTGATLNLADTVDEFPWHGSTDPDREEGLMPHLRARLEAVKDSRVREIGLDQFFGDPSPIDEKKDPSDPRVPLTERYDLDRFQVYRLKRKAKKVLREAFDEWTDMPPRP